MTDLTPAETQELHRPGVGSHLVGRTHDGVLYRHVVQRAALRAAPEHDARGVDHGERRPHEGGQVDDRLVDLLMQPVTTSTEYSVEVLHPDRTAGERVLLDDRHVDQAVGLDEVLQDRPPGEHRAAEIDIDAPPQVVWEVLTRFENWPNWNPDVKSMSFPGALAPGTEFRWKAGPGTIVSTLDRIEPPGYISWRGRTLTISAYHE